MATRKTSSRKTGGSKTGGRRTGREEESMTRGRASERGAQGEEETRAPRQARTRGDGQSRTRPSDGERRGGGAQRARGAGRGGMRTAGQDRKQIEREMEEMFGLVPDFYDAVPDSVVQHAWGVQRDFQLADTALDMKTKELIGLAVASQLKCRYCIYFHTQAAKAHGASEDELLEAAAMGGMTDMFSNMITGARVDFDQFQRDVDRAIEHMKQHAAQPSEGMGEAQI